MYHMKRTDHPLVARVCAVAHPDYTGQAVKIECAMKFVANWSGRYPNLCRGAWTLTAEVDGETRLIAIPRERVDCSMGTSGVYQKWHFDANFSEVFTSYYDGISAQEWIAANKTWLVTALRAADIAPTYQRMLDIYAAFQENDWRHNSCGGCI